MSTLPLGGQLPLLNTLPFLWIHMSSSRVPYRLLAPSWKPMIMWPTLSYSQALVICASSRSYRYTGSI
eukprot:15361681-Ditylum_brightwellii.AAC.1